MTFKSHIALGAIGGLTLGALTPIGEIKTFYTAMMPLIALGSVLPDIDEPKSFIGRKLPGFSHIISLTFTHRGFTHFLICPLLIAVIAGLFLKEGRFYVYALCFGMIMHQIGDMLTKSGIPYYFFPFKIKAVLLPKKLRFYTGGIIERLVFIFILIPLLGFISYQTLNFKGGKDVAKNISHYYKNF
ncbi:hypothetical protein BKH42_03510 [Helicobacter sp. 13S00482-2]|uniref:metal-dependent hydrolase n=1 Tax=Helicobacter sp. 13S00482-2 TaxID=1476200 RepID=UPI000BC9FB15|nr:metal-dependent hydrolase [Helicobacter sp. 13S00482-2]PAF53808.1 hypothetical protein BKH42_03510 [Helicobacter sp. 13S00482-2]